MENSPFYQWGSRYINKLSLHSANKILDLGCRSGSVSAYLANLYPQQHITAIDKPSSQLDFLKNYQLPNLQFEAADIVNLSCENYYDAIVSFNYLMWVQNKYRALQNIYRLLKPGKKAHLLLFACHGRPKNERFLFQTAQQPYWKDYFKNFSLGYFETSITELGGLLQRTGFFINRLEIVRYETMFQHSDVLQQFLSTWSTHHQCLPQKKRQAFLADASQAYLNTHHYAAQEAFPYHEYFLEVECEKPTIDIYNDAHAVYHFQHIEFTRQEARVIKYYLQGWTAKEISRQMDITAKTVEFHLGKVKTKLNCSLKSEIYQQAMALGFMQLIFDPCL